MENVWKWHICLVLLPHYPISGRWWKMLSRHKNCFSEFMWETMVLSIYWWIQVCDSKQLGFVPRRVFVCCCRRQLLLTVRTPVFASWVEADLAAFSGIVSPVIMGNYGGKKWRTESCWRLRMHETKSNTAHDLPVIPDI